MSDVDHGNVRSYDANKHLQRFSSGIYVLMSTVAGVTGKRADYRYEINGSVFTYGNGTYDILRI